MCDSPNKFEPIDVSKVDWNKMTPEQFSQMEKLFQKRRNDINRANRANRQKTRVRQQMETIDKSAENDPRNIKKVISIDGLVYEIPITIYVRLKEGLLTREYVQQNYKAISTDI